MPSVRMATDRAASLDVDVEAMVALIREAGTGRFIETMLDFCRKCVDADFVSILLYSRTGDPVLVGTETTTAAENARNAATATCGTLPATLTSIWWRAAASALTSPIRRRMRLLRHNTGAPAMSGRGLLTGFCEWIPRAPRPSVSIAAAAMAAFPIANSTEPMRFCRY